jgi:hypothetical protein
VPAIEKLTRAALRTSPVLGRIGPNLSQRQLQHRGLIIGELATRGNTLRERLARSLLRPLRACGLDGKTGVINEDQIAVHV